MSILDGLARCAGTWRGTNRLQDPHTGKPEESASVATITPLLGGRFVRFDYTWSYHGSPQEGSLSIGGDAQAKLVTAHWIDTWHMNDKVLACHGPVQTEETLSVRGSYAAPPGPDWGWKIDLHAGGQMLRMVMYNIWPEGKEELAVEAPYVRA